MDKKIEVDLKPVKPSAAYAKAVDKSFDTQLKLLARGGNFRGIEDACNWYAGWLIRSGQCAN